MPTPLDELKVRLDEIRTEMAFVGVAARLRPRIGPVINWAASGELNDSIRSFLDMKLVRPEGIYGPLLIKPN